MSQTNSKRADLLKRNDFGENREESLIALRVRDNRHSQVAKSRVVKASRNTVLGTISSKQDEPSYRALTTSNSNA